MTELLPTEPVAALRPLRARVRARVFPARVLSAALLVACGAAWLTVLNIDWNPALALAAVGVAASAGLVFVKARWAQAIVRAVAWTTLLCGAAVSLSNFSSSSLHLADRGPLLALPAGGALLLLSRLGRRVRGQQPMLFVATVLAIADIGFHALLSLFMWEEVFGGRDGMLFFPAIAVANTAGILALRRFHTAVPHVALNALVLVGAVVNIADVKGFVVVTIAAIALVQIAAAALAARPAPSVRVRRAAAIALRVAIALVMAASVVVVAVVGSD